MRVHRKFAIVIACLAAAIVTALGAAASASPTARQSAAPRLTWAKIFAMSSTQIAALQNPLLAAVAPVQAVGSTSMRSIYWGTALDTPGHAVDLYVTDPIRAAALIAAAKRLNPGLDTGLIRVMRTAYSFAALKTAGDRVLMASIAKRLPFPVYVVGQLDHGASLRLKVPDVARARAMSYVPLASLGGRSVAQLAGVRLTFEQVKQAVPATRENDTPPFIGGDYLHGTGSDSTTFCTAGISIENSSGRDFLITANHCFHSGNAVTTMNGATTIGTPYRYNNSLDAELIDTGKYNGAGANADEGEYDTSNGGIKWYPLTASDPAWATGQIFCQDGIKTYLVRHVVTCNLYTEGYTSWTVCTQKNGPACSTITSGLQTQSDDGNPAVIQGDSGGVVFTVASSTTRSVGGMVDYETSNSTTGCFYVSATDHNLECPDMYFVWWGDGLYNAFGFTGRLNPHT